MSIPVVEQLATFYSHDPELEHLVKSFLRNGRLREFESYFSDLLKDCSTHLLPIAQTDLQKLSAQYLGKKTPTQAQILLTMVADRDQDDCRRLRILDNERPKEMIMACFLPQLTKAGALASEVEVQDSQKGGEGSSDSEDDAYEYLGLARDFVVKSDAFQLMKKTLELHLLARGEIVPLSHIQDSTTRREIPQHTEMSTSSTPSENEPTEPVLRILPTDS
jgi:hypothetical protein